MKTIQKYMTIDGTHYQEVINDVDEHLCYVINLTPKSFMEVWEHKAFIYLGLWDNRPNHVVVISEDGKVRADDLYPVLHDTIDLDSTILTEALPPSVQKYLSLYEEKRELILAAAREAITTHLTYPCTLANLGITTP